MEVAITGSGGVAHPCDGVLRCSSYRRVVSDLVARVIAAVLTFAHCAIVAAQVPDLAREQRLANQISDAILDGEVQLLDDGKGHRFLTIYMQSDRRPARGTVVLMHGRGLHPDWVSVIQPLRVGLAEQGWNTFSIQLPVLEKEARYYDYLPLFGSAMPRIEAALEEARQRDPGPVVLLAHSCGAHMAQHWVLRRGESALERFDGFIGIGMGATDVGQPMREPFALSQMPMPVLDLYAEHDYPAVHRLAGRRQAAMLKGGNRFSEQLVVPDAEHYFVDRGDALLAAVGGWLRRAYPVRVR
ncbi:MAG: DUF3530 family protein [Gammaproteobacteria bacterium]|nr:DUF3530 family protein [Gammaproteobacteria bacterium]